jgi:hypothetical protein
LAELRSLDLVAMEEAEGMQVVRVVVATLDFKRLLLRASLPSLELSAASSTALRFLELLRAAEEETGIVAAGWARGYVARSL